tara:strand:+ start:9017 stop:9826 length:810 start_codon:yes stop_codon:yes gene_type:complete
MAKHGYTVDWQQFNGACAGSDNVHYGHEDAPALIQQTIGQLIQYLEVTMPRILEEALSEVSRLENDDSASVRELRSARRRVSSIESQIEHAIPTEINRLKERKEGWSLGETYEVDLIKEAAEEKARKKAERDAKLAEKAKADEEKAARKAEREEKAAAKYRTLIAEQWRQVVINGEVAVEWQAAYDSDGEYWRDMGDKLVNYIVMKTLSGDMSVDDYYDKPYKVVFKSRTGQGKQGKQIDSYKGLGLPVHRILDDPRIKQIIQQRKEKI